MFIYSFFYLSHRKTRINFGVIANHFGKVNRKTANHFKLICESLFKWYRKKTFILVLTPFLDKISSFLNTFYVYDAKMRIRCELWLVIVSHFAKVCLNFTKIANHFSFLKSRPVYTHLEKKVFMKTLCKVSLEDLQWEGYAFFPYAYLYKY